MQQLEQKLERYVPNTDMVFEIFNLRTYNTMDLESLSASQFYTGPLSKPSPIDGQFHAPQQIPEMKYFRETIRFDGDKPLHLNYENWLDLKGSKLGRSKKLLNIHIPLEDDNK